mmetsp:Transcript_81421/g.264343  ORF Transcript_81421/g.264343 Transcript_81421/m.264343 type:complete len:426 (-) Transcript_81421:9-1286(-)
MFPSASGSGPCSSSSAASAPTLRAPCPTAAAVRGGCVRGGPRRRFRCATPALTSSCRAPSRAPWALRALFASSLCAKGAVHRCIVMKHLISYYLAVRPIIHCFGRRFTYITWDYRGLFGSSRPKSLRRLSVCEHAHDAAEVLHACGFDFADVVVGWSMGVQVGLEFALLYPDAAGRLVLINGAHGQVFHSALQPIVRLPIVHDVARAAMMYVATHPAILRTLRRVSLFLIPTVVRLYVRCLGSRLLKVSRIFGNQYVETTLVDLLDHLCQDEKTMETYLWLFQELNAHSVYHLLGSVEQDSLLISGMFDILLPPYHMWEMQRRMSRATHICDCWSSHFTLLEHPEIVLKYMRSSLMQWGLLTASDQHSISKKRAWPCHHLGDGVVHEQVDVQPARARVSATSGLPPAGAHRRGRWQRPAKAASDA